MKLPKKKTLRTERIALRLSKSELRIVCSNARALNMTVSEFARHAMLEYGEGEQ